MSSRSWQTDGFAYADSYDEEHKRYLNLRAGEAIRVVRDARSLLVKPAVALAQFAAQEEAAARAAKVRAAAAANYAPGTAGSSAVAERPGAGVLDAPVSPSRFPESSSARPVPTEKVKTRFHGTLKLDPRKPGKQVNDLTVEILQHLTSRLDCQVEVTLEISATDLSGFPEDIQRIIKENCATLKFERDVEFEEI